VRGGDRRGFLFSGYESERWWFELWNSVREALFTGLSILLIPLGRAMQAWGALLLLVLFLVPAAGRRPLRPRPRRHRPHLTRQRRRRCFRRWAQALLVLEILMLPTIPLP
jgi:hypothetical protein